jgi:hypothetical protein
VRDAKRSWSSTESNHVAFRFGAAAAHHKMPATRVRAQSKRCRPLPLRGVAQTSAGRQRRANRQVVQQRAPTCSECQ